VETVEGVCRAGHVIQTATNGDDDAGLGFYKARQRYIRDARRHQGAGEQPGECAQQPARV